MDAIAVDAEGNAGEPGRMTPRTMAAAVIGLASLLLLALGAYWLIARDLGDGATATIVEARPEAPASPDPKAAPPVAEPLLRAPPATCVDGKPARPEISPDDCL
jgi:hypothetical protein